MNKNKTLLILISTLIVSSIIITIFFYNQTSIKRPQEPTKPYPYYSKDITFQNNKTNISLAGTLTLPLKYRNLPAVILISGSGPQNRNEEVAGHKPFLVIADYLARNGIAVLRYDDRGVGKSKGEFKTANLDDFAIDASSAIEYLKTRKEIDKNRIGLIGHSEGGLVAPMVAASRDDVNFIVLLASPGIETRKILLKQAEEIPRSMGASEDFIQKNIAENKTYINLVSNSNNNDTLKNKITQLFGTSYDETPSILIPENMTKKEYIAIGLNLAESLAFKDLLKLDPTIILQKISCPVLALNGEKDIQVSAQENLAGIYKALVKGGNTDVTIKEIPNLNHLFQVCETCTLEEYETIEQTFSPKALKEIANWILEKVK